MPALPTVPTTVPAHAPVIGGNPAANVGHSLGSVFGSVGKSAGHLVSPSVLWAVALLFGVVLLLVSIGVYRYLRRGPVGSGGDGAVWPHVGSDGS